MNSVICIAGLDPSAHAGLSADIRALEYLGIRPLPIASVLTVQNSRTFSEFQPVPLETMIGQLDAVLQDNVPGAAKLGMMGTAETAIGISGILADQGIPIICDPVLCSSTGMSLAGDELIDAYKHDVFPVSRLITPNAIEAGLLTGIDVVNTEAAKDACMLLSDLGTESVLVKGGHFKEGIGTDILFDGDFKVFSPMDIEPGRGSGCILSSMIAGQTSLGRGIDEAVRLGRQGFQSLLRILGDTPGIAAASPLNKAVSRLLNLLTPELIAEVGNNIAYAPSGKDSPGDMLSLDSRILAKGGKAITLGQPVKGRKSHVGRVVLAAMAHDNEKRCATNLRYSDELVEKIKGTGMTIASFGREREPQDSSSMEWGTGKAIESFGSVPDAIYDRGGLGKEPMVRLLARDPEELILKLEKILGAD